MTALTSAGPPGRRARPPGGLVLAYRQFRFWASSQRRTWRGTVLSALFGPLLYLTAMGLGLGTLVNKGHQLPGGVPYLDFVAPGVLAATGMQGAFAEATYPVLGSFKWVGNYWAAVNTPLRPRDVMAGHVLWMTLRLTGMTGFFFAVMALFGVVRSPLGLLAWPAAVLVGVAFALPTAAYVATRHNDQSLSFLFRFVMTPLFLFSGTFFPWRQLPGWAHPIAYATPLWQGTELCRSLTGGTATWGASLVHAAYLLALAALGYFAAIRTYRRRLYL